MLYVMDSTLLLFIVIILGASFVHSAIGFGMGLIAMPLLTIALGIETAVPVIALQAVLLQLALALYYRQSMQFREIGVLVVATLIGVPVGVWLLDAVPEPVIVAGLGVILALYGLYSLITPKLPKLDGNGWAWGAGLISGVLTGAYNTGGPPLVMYGNARRWEPEAFKGTLQGVNFIKSLMVIIAHVLAANFHAGIWPYFWVSIPVTALGIALGVWTDRLFNAKRFAVVIQVALVLLGIQLIISALGG